MCSADLHRKEAMRMAAPAGYDPAIFCVTDRYVSQLHYGVIIPVLAHRNNEMPLTSYYCANNNNNEFLISMFAFHQLYLSHFLYRYVSTVCSSLDSNQSFPVKPERAFHYTIRAYGCFDNPGRASWGGKFHPLTLRQNAVPTFIVKGSFSP